jgi:hypothetical protein
MKLLDGWGDWGLGQETMKAAAPVRMGARGRCRIATNIEKEQP